MTTLNKNDRLATALPLVYPLGASLLPIMLRALTPHFDNYTLIFIPFLAGSLVQYLLAWLLYRADLAQTWRDTRLLRNILLLVVVGFTMNMLFVEGIRRTSATFSGLMSLLGVPLTTALAALFFADERDNVRSWRFALGFLMAVGGTFGLTLSRGSIAADWVGALCLFGSTMCMVTIGLLAKKLTITGQPVCVVTVQCVIETAFFGVVWLALGDPGSIARAPLDRNALMVFYGVFGLLLTGAVYFVMIQRAGVVVALFTHQLVTPVFTALFAFVLLGEVLVPVQLAFGAVLLAGCALILLQQRRGRVRLPRSAPGESPEQYVIAVEDASVR
jgi:drug/metabolite transporter (DMT)-like permease